MLLLALDLNNMSFWRLNTKSNRLLSKTSKIQCFNDSEEHLKSISAFH